MYREKLKNEQLFQNQLSEATELLKETCYNLSKEAGWHDTHREVGTMLMLVVSEVAEAMEGIRKNLKDDKLPQYDMFSVEIADAIIRLFDLSGLYKIPIGEILVEKLKYNTIRPDHQKENRQKANGKKF